MRWRGQGQAVDEGRGVGHAGRVEVRVLVQRGGVARDGAVEGRALQVRVVGRAGGGRRRSGRGADGRRRGDLGVEGGRGRRAGAPAAVRAHLLSLNLRFSGWGRVLGVRQLVARGRPGGSRAFWRPSGNGVRVDGGQEERPGRVGVSVARV